MNAQSPSEPSLLAIIARAAADARRVWSNAAGPVALLIDQASGRIQSIGPASHLPPSIPLIEHPDAILLPGLVNAHTHLDLTGIGPRPHDPSRGFMPWIDMVRRERPTDDAAIAAAVRTGIALSLAGGTAAVGDIAGAPRAIPSLVPIKTIVESPLSAVSFLEFFAIGNGLQRGMEAIAAAMLEWRPRAKPRLGLQPHAPNTVSLAGYRHALDLARAPRNLPLCTHLAESPEEREFIAHARGSQRELLESLGLWNDEVARELGQGRSPIEHLAPIMQAARRQSTPFTAVHCNDASDADLDILDRTSARVVYCPRASDYFGAPARLGPHRYRDMLARSIPVALGTDSIINLPPAAASPESGGISILDEMRHLHRRDGTDPSTLLAMATLHGAAALDMAPGLFQLAPGTSPLAILAIDVSGTLPGSNANDPRTLALLSESPAKIVWTRKNAAKQE